ncbi:MAG: hypothetical protein IIZ56_02340 [Clostridia bacterium]|nr:hypothetical protein [Clostridia bacterium]MBR4659136.1 hypothetical protein [Clostridia bacterium]MBR6109703.1 hypothetical protein [Clostridia bacterium]
MKKTVLCIVTFLLAAAMLMSFAACGGQNANGASKPAETAKVSNGKNSASRSEANKGSDLNKQNKITSFEIEAASCVKDGFQVLLANANETVDVSAKAKGSTVPWKIYVSDNKYSSASELKPEELVLEGAGKLSAKAGQYIYVTCGTDDITAADGAALTFSGKHLSR